MNNQYRNPVAALTNKKNEIYISDLPAVLGRDDNSVDIYFFHESISREHCLFECINRRVTIRDLGSTVGTAVNGVKLEPNIPYNIEDGAKITIGKVKFVFHVDYEEIARRDRMQASVNAQGTPPYSNAGSFAQESVYTGSNPGRTPKTVTVYAKELTEYEYGEEEVVFIECGLKPESKPLSFTSELRKKELEAEELKKTQFISKEEMKEEDEALPEDPVPDDTEEGISDHAGTSGEKDADHRTLRLSWIDDETGDTKKVTIDQFPFSIGRKSDENDYALRRKGVSRKHFHFEESDGKYYVIDDDSTNGVKLNGVRIKAGEKTEISSGDRINIANITIAIKIK